MSEGKNTNKKKNHRKEVCVIKCERSVCVPVCAVAMKERSKWKKRAEKLIMKSSDIRGEEGKDGTAAGEGTNNGNRESNTGSIRTGPSSRVVLSSLKSSSECMKHEAGAGVCTLTTPVTTTAGDRNSGNNNKNNMNNRRKSHERTMGFTVVVEAALQPCLVTLLLLFLILISGADSYPLDPIEEEIEHPRLSLISWRWHELEGYLIVSMFLLTAALVKVAYHQIEALHTHVPESCVLIVLGTTVGLVVHLADMKEHIPQFSSELFFFLLLPPIILESAYSLYDKTFFNNIRAVLLYAVVGTLLNVFFVGSSLFLVEQFGWFGRADIPLVECFTFSTLISAVDPVAVLAIFQELGVNKEIYFLVFGESLFNDAVVITLYNMVTTFAVSRVISTYDVVIGILNFITVSGGGLVIGLLTGAVTALATKFTTDVRVVEPLIVVVLAYFSYVGAELFHFSGIISLIACGLVQSEYVKDNISKRSFTTIKYFTKTLSSIADVIIFFFLGRVLIHPPVEHVWDTGFVFFSSFFCIFYRFVIVFILTYIANRYIQRVRMINFEEQLLMAYGGLRGAIAFSLAIMLEENHVKHARIFITTSLFIVLFTVFILGSTTKPVVRWLEVRLHIQDETSMFIEINSKVIETVMSGIEEVAGHRSVNYWNQKLVRFNEKYLKNILTRGDGHSFKDTFEMIYAGFVPVKPDKAAEALQSSDCVQPPLSGEQEAAGGGSESVSLEAEFVTNGRSTRDLSFVSQQSREEEGLNSDSPHSQGFLAEAGKRKEDHETGKSVASYKKIERCEYQNERNEKTSLLTVSPLFYYTYTTTTEKTATNATSSSLSAAASAGECQQPAASSSSSAAGGVMKRSFKGLIRGVGGKAVSLKISKVVSGDENSSDFERRFIASAFSRSPYFHLPGQHEVERERNGFEKERTGGSPSGGSVHHPDDEEDEDEDGMLDPFRHEPRKSKWASARFRLENLATRTDSPVPPASHAGSRSKDPLTGSASFPLLELARVQQHHQSLKRQQEQRDGSSRRNSDQKQHHSQQGLANQSSSSSTPAGREADQKEHVKLAVRDDDGVGGRRRRGRSSAASCDQEEGEEEDGGSEGRHSMSQAELEPLRKILMSRKRSTQFISIAETLLLQKRQQDELMNQAKQQEEVEEEEQRPSEAKPEQDRHEEETRDRTLCKNDVLVVVDGTDDDAIFESEKEDFGEAAKSEHQQQESAGGSGQQPQQEVASSSESRSPDQSLVHSPPISGQIPDAQQK